ncbi:MAG: hypothetical protein O7G31_02655 [Calditrichaeota bacterium]|nr:hypothetical protein [Calditrichota bacterium]
MSERAERAKDATKEEKVVQTTHKLPWCNSVAFVVITFIGAAVLGLLLSFAPCLAQEEGTAARDSTRDNRKFDVEKRKKEHSIFLDKIEILGKIEKPQTAFIIKGKDPTVDDIEIDRSFFHQIFRPVERDQLRKKLERMKRSERR